MALFESYARGGFPQKRREPAAPTLYELRAASQFLADARKASEASLSGAMPAPLIEGNAK